MHDDCGGVRSRTNKKASSLDKRKRYREKACAERHRSPRDQNAKIIPLCSYADKLMSGKEEFKDILN